MGALPTPPPAQRYIPYREELHEFFADHHLYFGMPSDILPLNARLQQPGEFRDQMIAKVQSILARESGLLSTAELLEIVAVSIGGAQIQHASPELNQPLSELYDFLAGVFLAEPEPEERSPAEVVSFPAPVSRSDAFEASSTGFGPLPARPMRGDAEFGVSPVSVPARPVPGPPFRKLLMAGAVAVVVAIILAVCLRPKSLAPHPAAASSSTTTVAHPSKPSAYGEAFSPTPPPRKHRARAKSANAAGQPSGGGSGTQPVNSAR